nr:zinc finger protein 239-like [Misgurnus anguillicaudatus]
MRDQMDVMCCKSDVSGVSLCGFTDQTSTDLLVSVCNEDQKTSVNLLDCGIEVKQEDTEADESDLIDSDQKAVKEELSEIEENSHHLISKEESLSCSITVRNFSPKRKNKQKATAKDAIICPQCGKTFPYKCKLIEHMSVHTGEKPYRCDQCGKNFKNKWNLYVHMRVHTGKEPYRCDQCGRSFNNIGHLNYHTRTHTGEKPYRCDQCGKSFNDKGHLKYHTRTHTGEKPYSCDQCEKSFYNKCHLNYHTRTHTGENRYRCDQCEKSYIRKFDLKRHMSIHTGDRP